MWKGHSTPKGLQLMGWKPWLYSDIYYPNLVPCPHLLITLLCGQSGLAGGSTAPDSLLSTLLISGFPGREEEVTLLTMVGWVSWLEMKLRAAWGPRFTHKVKINRTIFFTGKVCKFLSSLQKNCPSYLDISLCLELDFMSWQVSSTPGSKEPRPGLHVSSTLF